MLPLDLANLKVVVEVAVEKLCSYRSKGRHWPPRRGAFCWRTPCPKVARKREQLVDRLQTTGVCSLQTCLACTSLGRHQIEKALICGRFALLSLLLLYQVDPEKRRSRIRASRKRIVLPFSLQCTLLLPSSSHKLKDTSKQGLLSVCLKEQRSIWYSLAHFALPLASGVIRLSLTLLVRQVHSGTGRGGTSWKEKESGSSCERTSRLGWTEKQGTRQSAQRWPHQQTAPPKGTRRLLLKSIIHLSPSSSSLSHFWPLSVIAFLLIIIWNLHFLVVQFVWFVLTL